jgi:hypothetical protein
VSQASSLAVNDVIMINGSDASTFLRVATSVESPASVTTVTFTPVGAVGTANITNNAVTSAKIATNVIQFAAVPMTAAQFNGMFAAPFAIVAAPGAGNTIVVERAVLAHTFAVAYTGGGVIDLQYGATINGAGPQAAATIAAAAITGDAASSLNMMQGTLADLATSVTTNTGLFLSNATAAFATGTGAMTVNIWYRIVPAI